MLQKFLFVRHSFKLLPRLTISPRASKSRGNYSSMVSISRVIPCAYEGTYACACGFVARYSRVERDGEILIVHDIVVFRLHRTMGPFPEVERKLCLPAWQGWRTQPRSATSSREMQFRPSPRCKPEIEGIHCPWSVRDTTFFVFFFYSFWKFRKFSGLDVERRR